MSFHLNQRAWELALKAEKAADDLRIDVRQLAGGAQVLDFGVEAAGGLEAGLMLARICMADMGQAEIVPGRVGEVGWPHVQVCVDLPTVCCLLSQYAGWQISVGRFFAMGSGPMRAAAVREELFEKLAYKEVPTHQVGVLESGRLPDDEVVEYICERSGVAAAETVLCVAPTSSQAGTVQIAARSVETALHKLFELGFDVNRIESGWGLAPLAPVAGDDLAGIGRTNDAILYGGRVMLWVRGDDESLAEIGPKVPSAASGSHGRPFLEIFEEAGRDFYAIDPHLFSPAEVVFVNLDTGFVHRCGRVSPDVLAASFGIEDHVAE